MLEKQIKKLFQDQTDFEADTETLTLDSKVKINTLTNEDKLYLSKFIKLEHLFMNYCNVRSLDNLPNLPNLKKVIFL